MPRLAPMRSVGTREGKTGGEHASGARQRKTSLKLTDEQSDAVDLFRTSRSLKVSAFAGTGKTSTLTAMASSTGASGVYLAFNKSIAQEASGRFPRTVDCRTTHSIAYRALPSGLRSNPAKLTQAMSGNRVARLLDLEELRVADVTIRARSLGYLTSRTIQRFCQSGDATIEPRHVPMTGKLQQLDAKYQDEFALFVSKLASHLWSRMVDPGSDAPLGHDGYLKLWSLSRPRLHYDFVLLDEAQDTNEAVLSVLRAQGCQLTLVGDQYQQIYEWRGATNAMASVATDAEAYLTRSFRFGSRLADAATSILRILKETRSVLGDPDKDTRIESGRSAGTILCRTNAGVIDVVVDALQEGRTPFVVGGVNELVRLLEDVSRLRAGQPADSPEFFGFRNWAELVDFSQSEEGETLRSFVKIVNTYGEGRLISQLRSVAKSESAADLIVSTGHKAKGREWDSVALNSDFEPRVSKSDPGKSVLSREEAQLLYVAVTRAKSLLVVPPRLAAKWNVPLRDVPLAPKALRTGPRSGSEYTAVSTGVPLPPLPSFATVAAAASSDAPAEASLPARNVLLPRQPSMHHAEGRPLHSEPVFHAAASGRESRPGLIATLFRVILGIH